MADLKYSDRDYLEFDLFVGEDADIKCRTVKLVKTRKKHPCFFGQNGDGHNIAPGQYVRYEKALIDGDYWGSYYLCIPCLNREMADLRGDIP